MLANAKMPIDHRFLLYTLGDLMGVENIDHTPVKKFSIFSPSANFVPRDNVDGDNIDDLIRQGATCREP